MGGGEGLGEPRPKKTAFTIWGKKTEYTSRKRARSEKRLMGLPVLSGSQNLCKRSKLHKGAIDGGEKDSKKLVAGSEVTGSIHLISEGRVRVHSERRASLSVQGFWGGKLFSGGISLRGGEEAT